MTYRAVLFDLDGTLLDTLEDLADSMNSVLHGMGAPEHAPEAYKYFVGNGMENLVRRALPPDYRQDEPTVHRCLAAMREAYAQHWREKTLPYSGVPDLLDQLVDRKIRLAILSNKPDDFTKLAVSMLLPRWTFAEVLGERPPIPRKPDPKGALEIAERLGIPPDEFLYLGDSSTDMQTANAAGMYAVGALWGFRTADELTESGARVLIENPLELLTLI